MNEANKISFYEACELGNTEFVKVYVEKHFLSLDNFSRIDLAFYKAGKNGHLETTKYLFEKILELDIYKHYRYKLDDSFCLICQGGHIEIIKYLAEHNCEDIFDYWGVFENICRYFSDDICNLDVVEYLKNKTSEKCDLKVVCKNIINRLVNDHNSETKNIKEYKKIVMYLYKIFKFRIEKLENGKLFFEMD